MLIVSLLAVSVLLIVIGIVVLNSVGALFILGGAIMFFITGIVLAVKEIKTMRLNNFKRLFLFSILSYALALLILLSGFAMTLYFLNTTTSLEGMEALGYVILGLLIAAGGFLLFFCLTVWLVVRKIINEKRKV